VVVPQRLPDGLPDGLEAGEVDDGVDPVFVEDGVERGLVHQVHPAEDGGSAAELGDAAQGFLAGVHQVVDDHDLMAGLLQGQDRVRTDVAGPASNQNSHGFTLSQAGAAAGKANPGGGLPVCPRGFRHIRAKKD